MPLFNGTIDEVLASLILAVSHKLSLSVRSVLSVFFGVGHGSKFLHPTQPDPQLKRPNPTRNKINMKLWTRPILTHCCATFRYRTEYQKYMTSQKYELMEYTYRFSHRKIQNPSLCTYFSADSESQTDTNRISDEMAYKIYSSKTSS